MGKRIELTELEYRMLLLLVDDETYIQPTTDEEIKAACSMIKKAEDLIRELDAYDELDNSLVKWFLASIMNRINNRDEGNLCCPLLFSVFSVFGNGFIRIYKVKFKLNY